MCNKCCNLFYCSIFYFIAHKTTTSPNRNQACTTSTSFHVANVEGKNKVPVRYDFFEMIRQHFSTNIDSDETRHINNCIIITLA